VYFCIVSIPLSHRKNEEGQKKKTTEEKNKKYAKERKKKKKKQFRKHSLQKGESKNWSEKKKRRLGKRDFSRTLGNRSIFLHSEEMEGGLIKQENVGIGGRKKGRDTQGKNCPPKVLQNRNSANFRDHKKGRFKKETRGQTLFP